MKLGYILLLFVVVTACGERSVRMPDQCLRSQLFQECLKLVPKGPSSVVNNDWDEVVEQCADAAYYQSLRDISVIPEQCRSRTVAK